MLDLAEGKPEQTLREFNRALALPRPGTALEQAAILGANGEPKLGLEHLDYFTTLAPRRKSGWSMARIHAWVLRHQGYWAREIERLRKTLRADAGGATPMVHKG
jgi:hypothetical protein